jgi:hypothetical protein
MRWLSWIARAFRATTRIQRACLIAVPTILLLYDFLRFPVTFSVRGLSDNISVVSLVANRLLPVGTYNTHTIHVSLDDISRDDFLDYVKGSPNAIVITHFVDEDSATREGALGRTLREKLNRLSPDAGRQFKDRLDHLEAHQAGDVAQLDVHIPLKSRSKLPIDRIYVVLLNVGLGHRISNEGILSKAIPEVLKRAARDRISSLVLPCLGYKWNDKGTLAFDEFFRPLLSSLSSEGPPKYIYISLYGDWPTFTVEEAVKSFNYCWSDIVSPSTYGAVFRLYRAEYRATLFFLTVCLLVSSFYAPLTIKNFLIICVSFIAMTMGSIKTIDFVTQGYGVVFSAVLKVTIWVFFAIAFPFLVNWNPKNIFCQKGNSP